MAKIVATFDTVEKTLAVTEDGGAVANVYEVNFCLGYSSGDDEPVPYRCSVMTLAEEKDNGLMRMTRLMAAESAALAAEAPKEQPKPAEEPKKDLASDVAAYLSKE